MKACRYPSAENFGQVRVHVVKLGCECVDELQSERLALGDEQVGLFEVEVFRDDLGGVLGDWVVPGALFVVRVPWSKEWNV